MITAWTETERLLRNSFVLLDAEVAKEFDCDVKQILEFLDHNELGLAFDYLFSIVQEAQWNSAPILQSLVIAAESMGLAEEVGLLNNRVSSLHNQEHAA